MRHVFPLLALLILSACAATTTNTPADENAAPVLTPVAYSALPGWYEEDWKDFAQAYEASCTRLQKRDPAASFSSDTKFGKNSDWQNLCAAHAKLSKNDPTSTRLFFETYFTPHAVSAGGKADGLFTGYYEATLRGSPVRTDIYNVPLHARPGDLVMVNLGDFREELKGQRIAGRVVDGTLKPYETRAEILSGALPDAQEKVLVWVDDAVDAFFVQVQGSGVVQMTDGTVKRIGYDGQNGHVYYAIGRELVKRGELPKEDVSMQSIRAWLAAHPAQANELMNTNKSYVFFRELEGAGGPVGGEGVSLTPLRSLAIDHGKYPYGFPVWLDTDQPQLTRMMMAQDTGGAIKGAVRGDVFWGYGDQAESNAGVMKSPGRYWIMLPKNITP